MDIRPKQLSLPMHDVGKTQALRKRLDENKEASQDLRDIISLSPGQAQEKIIAREDLKGLTELTPGEGVTWAKRVSGLGAYTAAVLGGAATTVCGIAMAAMVAGGLVNATAGVEKTFRAEVMKDQLDAKNELVDAAKSDPHLIPLLRENEEWMHENKTEISAGPSPANSEKSVFSKLKGAANVVARSPEILVTPLINARNNPKNIADEALNSLKGSSAAYIGLGAIGGAAVMIASTGLTPGFIADAFSSNPVGGLFLTGLAGVGLALNGALGGAFGLIAGKASAGMTTPLSIGRKTKQDLGEGEHSLWSQYKTGVKLAAKEAYALGQS